MQLPSRISGWFNYNDNRIFNDRLNLWPQTSKTILVLLMFVGACAGSTGGGIKVSRFVILIKTIIKELNSYIHLEA